MMAALMLATLLLPQGALAADNTPPGVVLKDWSSTTYRDTLPVGVVTSDNDKGSKWPPLFRCISGVLAVDCSTTYSTGKFRREAK